MHLLLIGMSNIGKSHWSKKLADQAGYTRLECDALVEAKLEPELKRLGYMGITDVARWMGQPYEPQYSETSQKYMACETAVMQEIVELLRKAPTSCRYVVDTTGSVIYIDKKILEDLKALTRVIYFEASAAHVNEMFQRYIAKPKPVIWDHQYQPSPQESSEESLKRCYPQLLKSRAVQYSLLADITLPFEEHKKPEADVNLILSHRERCAG